MIYLVLGLTLLAVFLIAGRALTRVPAAQIAKQARFSGVAVLVGLAGLLLLTGRVGAMNQVLALASYALRNSSLFRSRPKGFDDIDAGTSDSGPQITTDYLSMRLDAGSGAVDGRFIKGPWKGRDLADCTQDDLLAALAGMADDAESIRLLEAYLDRTFPSWREHHDQGADGGRASTANAGGMAEDEAYEVLGLEPGATTDAVRSAHRRLMASIHPDKGGSTYLAAKINLAKEVLMRSRGAGS